MEMMTADIRDKRKVVWDAHCALRRTCEMNDFDYITLGWLLGYHTQGMEALVDVMTEEDMRTCEQLCGSNGYFIFKMLEARRGTI